MARVLGPLKMAAMAADYDAVLEWMEDRGTSDRLVVMATLRISPQGQPLLAVLEFLLRN